MIEGINVLSAYTWQEPIGGTIGMFILFMILSILETVLCRYTYKNTKSKLGKFVLVCIPIFCYVATIGMTISEYNQHLKEHQRYVITVDDSCSYNEFVSTFDIISIEEDQYVVQVKED